MRLEHDIRSDRSCDNEHWREKLAPSVLHDAVLAGYRSAMKLAAGPIPLYHQLEQDIVSRIKSGEFAAGQRLPSEEQIGRQYGVSRITVRKALDTLTARGFIVRRRGVGSHVADRQDGVHAIQLSGSLDEFLTTAYQLNTKVISLGVDCAPPDVAEDFGLSTRGHILRLELLSHGNEGPLAHALFYFRQEVDALLTVEDLTGREPVIRTLERKMGIRISRATQVIEAAAAGHDTARYLSLKLGTPLLKTSRRYFTADGELVEIAQLLHHPSRYRYEVILRAAPFAV